MLTLPRRKSTDFSDIIREAQARRLSHKYAANKRCVSRVNTGQLRESPGRQIAGFRSMSNALLVCIRDPDGIADEVGKTDAMLPRGFNRNHMVTAALRIGYVPL